MVTWKVHDHKVRFVDVQYRQLDGIWQTAASNLSPAQEEYTVTGLEKDTTYEFRLLLKEQKDSAGEAVYAVSKGKQTAGIISVLFVLLCKLVDVDSRPGTGYEFRVLETNWRGN